MQYQDTYRVLGHIYSTKCAHASYIAVHSSSMCPHTAFIALRGHIYSSMASVREGKDTYIVLLRHTYSTRTHSTKCTHAMHIAVHSSSLCPYYVYNSMRTHIEQQEDTYIVLRVRMLCIQQYAAVVCVLILRLYQHEDTYIAVCVSSCLQLIYIYIYIYIRWPYSSICVLCGHRLCHMLQYMCPHAAINVRWPLQK